MMKIFVSAILSILLLGATAFATLSDTNNKDIYIADGTRTMWGYDFPIILTSDLTFYVIDNLGNQTQITSNYSINTSTSMVTYPVSGSPLTAGYIFVLLRAEPLTQGTSLKNQYRLPLDVIETSLDKLTMITQQLQEQNNRSILGSVNQSTAIVFPGPQASLFLAWDPTGNFLVNTPGIPGPQGPAGPAGAGSGNVNGPGTNTDSFVPQWNGANSLLLKNGLGVGTSANNLLQLNSSAKIPAVDGSNVTNVNALSLNNKTVGTSANNIIALNGSSQLPAVNGSLLTNVNAVSLNSSIIGTSANNIIALNGSAKLPAVDGSLLTNVNSASFFVPNNIQTFTSSDTWVKPSGITSVYVKVWGAGGGTAGGKGGSGGGYSEGIIAVNANVTVTVGVGGSAGDGNSPGSAGGTSSFAGVTTIQATGGATEAGTAGAGSGGSVNLSGTAGNSTVASSGGGDGGDSGFGGGGSNKSLINGKFPGGGGFGANPTSNGTGSAGANGIVIVYY